jgi:hypothetical protein
MAQKPKHAVVSWEEQQFALARKFTVFLFMGRGQSIKEELSTYPAALKRARELDVSHRPALIYAVTPAGRQVAIGLNERDKYSAEWAKLHS